MTDPARPDLLHGLNPEQAEAVGCLSGPLLVVAGPGSGKTRVLVHRIAALLQAGAWPSQILAVSFTNKAAAEMRERVAALAGEEAAARMWLSTFHSACLRILRTHHEAAGLPARFGICDSSDSARLVTDVMREAGMLEGMSPQEAKAAARSAHSLISRTKNDGRGPAALEQHHDFQVRATAAVMRGYQERLATLGAVDFDDLLLRTLWLLRNRPEVTAGLRRRFRHLMVDEYQDTNGVQYEILRQLATGAESVCAVGDFDQCIYGFRGANPHVMSVYERDFPGARVVRLGQNYRSSAAIVEVAQAVIDPNPAVHRAPLRTQNSTGAPVRLHTAADNYAEARWVVDQIQDRGGALSDHAVLVRTNFLTRALETELARRSLSHQVVGALRFYDRAEVKDALAWLRLATNPRDALALERAAATPRRGLGPGALAKVAQAATTHHGDVVAAARSLTGGSDALGTKLSAFLEHLEQVADAAATAGPAGALRTVAGTVGLMAHLKAVGERDGSRSREENLNELITYAADFLERSGATDPEQRDLTSLTGMEQTQAFLENVALVSAAENATGGEAAQTGSVSLLTMHAAKGKEYPHVYVVGLEEGILPHSRAISSGEPAHLEEERRLLFVAVSRAKDTLCLSHARTRTAFDRQQSNPASRFLTDLPTSVRREDGPSWSAPATRTRAAGRVTSAPSPWLQHGQVATGDRVRHTMFGDGVVTATGAHTATVDFDGTERTLALGIAPLSKLE